MNYLIDTHILIWFIEGNDQLSKKAQVLISELAMMFVSSHTM